MLEFLLTLACSLALGIILWRLHVPGGMMIGAIIAAAALNISSGLASMPYAAKLTAQTIAGAFIGVSISRDDLRHLPRLIRPLLILLGCYLTVCLVTGFIVWRTSSVDLLTALMSCVPGGMSDVPIIAADMGADAPKVAVLHFVRMALGISVFPSLIRAIDRRAQSRDVAEASPQPAAEQPDVAPTAKKAQPLWAFPFCLLAGLAGGWLVRQLGIPAGTLVGSLLSTMLLRLRFGLGFLPPPVKKLAQAFSGAYIGCSVGYADLLELRFLILPAIVIVIAFAANCFFAGWLLRKRFGFERKMSMLAATPAGATDMALISSDIGVDDPDLVVIQILRMILVILLFPQLISLIVALAG